MRTGRQRKKLAARSKGGEFQTRRRKKRVYFCCVSSDIDVQKLFDYLVGAGGLLHGWKYQLYNDVLHLYKSTGVEEGLGPPTAAIPPNQPRPSNEIRIDNEPDITDSTLPYSDGSRLYQGSREYNPLHAERIAASVDIAEIENPNPALDRHSVAAESIPNKSLYDLYRQDSVGNQNVDINMFRISNPGAQVHTYIYTYSCTETERRTNIQTISAYIC